MKEESKTLKAVVTMEHNTNSNVTIEVIPRTIRQYVASGQPLPPDINLAIADPAEEGNYTAALPMGHCDSLCVPFPPN